MTAEQDYYRTAKMDSITGLVSDDQIRICQMDDDQYIAAAGGDLGEAFEHFDLCMADIWRGGHQRWQRAYDSGEIHENAIRLEWYIGVQQAQAQLLAHKAERALDRT